MGYIESFYWKRYFRSEEDARKNDIFDLINASITLASIEDPKEFRSRRMQIIESLFDADSQGPAKPKKRSNKIARTTPSKNQERIVIHGCKDHACKEESTVDADSQASAKPKKRSNKIARITPSKNRERIVIHGCKDHACKEESTDECFEEFDDHLERELDEHAQPIGFYSVNEPDNISAEESFEEFTNQLEKEFDEDAKPTEESFEEFANQLEKELDEDAQPIGFHNVTVPDKKRKAEVSKQCRSGTMFEADKKRKIEGKQGKRGNPSSRLRRDDKPKRGFGSRMKKIQKARF
ncbi:Hypothetical predicted protein [Olea europaea subsp. europaea]|uniref:Uncharacterized protein n=1 Tax=Olea europaea subsp. europaea TaxID=158383 RepID=A0A8S0SJU4_OLEEU|nr:Hypothetical predicted protein [Olea europaea subsp. europaea]